MNTYGWSQEAIDALLDEHGAESIEDLPTPIENNVKEGPEAEIDPFLPFRVRGSD